MFFPKLDSNLHLLIFLHKGMFFQGILQSFTISQTVLAVKFLKLDVFFLHVCLGVAEPGLLNRL